MNIDHASVRTTQVNGISFMKDDTRTKKGRKEDKWSDHVADSMICII